jgi:hypothetical protein
MTMEQMNQDDGCMHEFKLVNFDHDPPQVVRYDRLLHKQAQEKNLAYKMHGNRNVQYILTDTPIHVHGNHGNKKQ